MIPGLNEPPRLERSGHVNGNVDPFGDSPQAYYGPTSQQLAARQVIPRELPVFTGKPENWPLFIRAYVNTTKAYGYSDAENLARLQKYVQGYAYTRVQGRLLHPAGVPHAIAMLEMLFGRPEMLINSLLQKVRNTAAPDPEELGTYIDYGMAVQHLCDYLQAGGHEAHLNNPMLLSEMVE